MLSPRTFPQNSDSKSKSKPKPKSNSRALRALRDSETLGSGNAPAVSLVDVSFAYEGCSVLRDLRFEIPKGNVVCLLGPSGCGKTTVLRLIAGLECCSAGEIFLDGEQVCSRTRCVAPELRCSIGMVFQDFALFPHLSVAKNLSLAFRGGGGEGRENEEIARVLEMVELQAFADSYPQRLSGGQQQRVALARALVSRPRLLLLDEPFANLDVRLRDRIRDRTLHWIQSVRCSVLLVTHDAEEGMYMSDRLVVLDEAGRVVQSGTPHATYTSPCNAYVASLLSEVNRFSVTVVGGYAATPFGRFPVDFGGDNAEVVVRPQNLRLSVLPQGEKGDGERCVGIVEAARMIGGDSLVHLSSRLAEEGEGERGKVHLHARVAGCFLPEVGSRVLLSVARSDVLLFAGKGVME